MSCQIGQRMKTGALGQRIKTEPEVQKDNKTRLVMGIGDMNGMNGMIYRFN